MEEIWDRNACEIWRPGNDCHPFIKGRVALYAILRAAGIGQGDEILVPGFTCFVVAAAIGYTGARAIYYDIDPTTYNGDPREAIGKIGPATRAVIVQHTYGMPMELGELPARCRERGVLLVEDCAHAMGANTPMGPVGMLGDAAFASLQWSKPVTTGLGGLARANESGLAAKLSAIYKDEFPEPSAWKSFYLAGLSGLYNRFFRPSWYWRARDTYHWLSAHGLIHGSSSDAEFTDPAMPAGYRERFGASREKQLHRVLCSLPSRLTHRDQIAGIYSEWCRMHNVFTQSVTPGCRSAHLRFPLLVGNRDKLLAAAQDERLELGDWMNAPLHPREADASAFRYETGMCPIADDVAQHVINLPTHRHVDGREAERILSFLGKWRSEMARSPGDLAAPSHP